VEAARLAQTYLSRWRDYPRSISLLQTIIESRRKLWQNASESLWRFYYWKMFFISTCNSCGAGWRAFGQAVSQIPADAQAAIGDPRRPMWKPGDFFGRLLGASRGSALGDFPPTIGWAQFQIVQEHRPDMGGSGMKWNCSMPEPRRARPLFTIHSC
jgi:hypothetical protein